MPKLQRKQLNITDENFRPSGLPKEVKVIETPIRNSKGAEGFMYSYLTGDVVIGQVIVKDEAVAPPVPAKSEAPALKVAEPAKEGPAPNPNA